MKVFRNCRHCDKEFTTTEYRISKGKGKFCSKKCFNDSIAIPTHDLECEYCGTPFQSKRAEAKFCSHECFGRSQIKDREMVTLNCPECLVDFQRSTDYIERLNYDGRRFFCSKSCATIFSNKSRYDKRLLVCENCGKEMELNESDRKTRFCSHECYVEYDKERLIETCIENSRKYAKHTAEILKARWSKDPTSHPWHGRSHTPESREKMSETRTKKWIDGDYDSRRVAWKHGEHKSSKMNKTFSYRSSWELAFMIYLDKNEDVLKYDYECLRIPYRLKDGGKRWYIPDFLVHYKDGRVFLYEVKPEELKEYGINKLKSEAAESYCLENDMIYEFITEKNLRDELHIL